jgi:hypothetical protein
MVSPLQGEGYQIFSPVRRYAISALRQEIRDSVSAFRQTLRKSRTRVAVVRKESRRTGEAASFPRPPRRASAAPHLAAPVRLLPRMRSRASVGLGQLRQPLEESQPQGFQRTHRTAEGRVGLSLPSGTSRNLRRRSERAPAAQPSGKELDVFREAGAGRHGPRPNRRAAPKLPPEDGLDLSRASRRPRGRYGTCRASAPGPDGAR